MLLDDAMMLVDGHGMTCDEREIDMKDNLVSSLLGLFPTRKLETAYGRMEMFISSTKEK